MKKQTTTIAIASIFAVTSLFSVAQMSFEDEQGYAPSFGEGNVASVNIEDEQGYTPSYGQGNVA